MLDWLGQQRLNSQLDQNSNDYEREFEDATKMAEDITIDITMPPPISE